MKTSAAGAPPDFVFRTAMPGFTALQGDTAGLALVTSTPISGQDSSVVSPFTPAGAAAALPNCVRVERSNAPTPCPARFCASFAVSASAAVVAEPAVVAVPADFE